MSKMLWTASDMNSLIADFKAAKRRAAKKVKYNMPFGWKYWIQSGCDFDRDRQEYRIYWYISASFSSSIEDFHANGTWITLKWRVCHIDWEGINNFEMIINGRVGTYSKDSPWRSPLNEKLLLAKEDIPRMVKVIEVVVKELDPEPINQMANLSEHEMEKAARRKKKAPTA